MSLPTSLGAAASGYLEQEIYNDSALGLVVRLYDMSLLEVRRARAALAAGDWAAKGMAVRQASRCVSMLQCSLDMERGGEVALNLDRIYTYLQIRLSQAHVQRDEKTFTEVVEHLEELGGAWRQVARNESPPAEAAPRVSAVAATAAR